MYASSDVRCHICYVSAWPMQQVLVPFPSFTFASTLQKRTKVLQGEHRSGSHALHTVCLWLSVLCSTMGCRILEDAFSSSRHLVNPVSLTCENKCQHPGCKLAPAGQLKMLLHAYPSSSMGIEPFFCSRLFLYTRDMGTCVPSDAVAQSRSVL